MTASAGPDLPPLALSVRQPWAWAIIHGGKVIENRSHGSIRAGGMDCRRIAIHAATGLTEAEYRWGVEVLRDRHGVACPPPEALVRGAIIGAVTVVAIVADSDSPWFGRSRAGNRGLVLEDPVACAPVPARGALGYFAWQASGALERPKRWMRAYGSQAADGGTGNLFPDLTPNFRTPAKKPF